MTQMCEGKRALVVDDIPVNVKIMTILLEGLGMEVHSAFNAEEAVDKIPEGGVDLALLDIHLGGGMDGFQLSESLRHRHPEIVILGVTGNRVTPDFQEDAKAKGMNQVLEKPLTKDSLIEVLEQECPKH